MINTLNIDGTLALGLTCDGCGRALDGTEKYSLDLLRRASNAGWYLVGYETPDMQEPFRTCHYCSPECRKKWERSHRKSKPKGGEA